MMQHPLQALRPCRSTSRLPAMLIASLVVLGHVSGSAHLLFSRHAICPEHGEIIHLDEEISSATPVAAVAKSSAASLASSADVRSAEYSHDHCLVASYRRERVTLSSPPTSLWIASLSVRGVYLLQDVPRSPLVALFRLAPKNSPPA